MKVSTPFTFLPLLAAARLEVSTDRVSDGGRQLQGRTQFAFGNQEAQNLGWPIGSYTCVQREICTLNDDEDDNAGGAISQAEGSGVLGCKCCKKECSVANTDLSAINNCKDQCKARFGKEVCQLTGTIPSSSCIGINSPTTANTNTNSQVSPNRVGDCSLPIPDGPFSSPIAVFGNPSRHLMARNKRNLVPSSLSMACGWQLEPMEILMGAAQYTCSRKLTVDIGRTAKSSSL